MPQMAPLWWTSLFFMFITSFIMMWVLIYSLINYNFTTKKMIKEKMLQMNWKW